MPLRATQTPIESTSMWAAIKQLQRDLRELRAARRAENTSIGSGGITIQDPTRPEKIVIAPTGAVGIDDGNGGFFFPPGVMFHTGHPDEALPGEATAYNAPDGIGGLIPSFLLTTPDLGNGVSFYKLQAGVPDGDPAASILAAGNASVIISEQVFYVSLADENFTTLAFDASGAFFLSESWQTLTLNSSWTAAGSPWQTPALQKKIDGTVMLTGMIKPGTATNGTVVATLPDGYQPAADHSFKVSAGIAGTAADIYVHSSGTLTLQNVVGTMSLVSLSGIRFPL